MSSALHAPTSVDAPVVEPLPTTDEADRGFGLAIVWGSVIGIVAFAVLIALGVVGAAAAIDHDFEPGAVAAIAIWTGIWGGLFLGGTVAVGRWSMRQGH
jgi:hypothetical protein